MTNQCRCHGTAAHFEVNCPKMEKIVKIARADSQPAQGNFNKSGKSIDTFMAFETYDELKFPFQEENEPKTDTYNAQAFQAKGGHFLRNQNKGPFTTSAPPTNNTVPQNPKANNNPTPPKGPT